MNVGEEGARVLGHIGVLVKDKDDPYVAEVVEAIEGVDGVHSAIKVYLRPRRWRQQTLSRSAVSRWKARPQEPYGLYPTL